MNSEVYASDSNRSGLDVESLPSSGMQNFVGNSEAKSVVPIDSLRTAIRILNSKWKRKPTRYLVYVSGSEISCSPSNDKLQFLSWQPYIAGRGLYCCG